MRANNGCGGVDGLCEVCFVARRDALHLPPLLAQPDVANVEDDEEHNAVTAQKDRRRICLAHGLLEYGLSQKDLKAGCVDGYSFEQYQEEFIVGKTRPGLIFAFFKQLDAILCDHDRQGRALFVLLARHQIRRLLLSFLAPADVVWFLERLSARSEVLRLNLGAMHEKLAADGIVLAPLTQSEKQTFDRWTELNPIDNIHSKRVVFRFFFCLSPWNFSSCSQRINKNKATPHSKFV